VSTGNGVFESKVILAWW